MAEYVVLNAGGLAFPVEYSPPTGLYVSNVSSDFTTITGGGFGTEGATNVTFDNFSDGVANTAATVGAWQQLEGLSIASESRHNGSAYAAHHNFIAGATAGVQGLNSVLSRKWFVQYWLKLNDFDWGTGQFGSNSQHLSNVKFLRFWNPEGSATENFFTALGNGGLDESSFSRNENVPTMSTDYFSLKKSSLTNDVWHCLQFEFVDSSAPGEADGAFKCWFNGTLIETRAAFVGRTDTRLKRLIHAGFYNAWGPNTGAGETSRTPNNFYMTDVYVVPSLSRVEIGDNAVHGSCTHHEVQIPTAWSDTSITVTPYFGTFAAGASVYLFVVDENGNASDGYGPVTVPSVYVSSVSSDLTTITGGGFGTEGATNITFDNFSDGVMNTAATVGTWEETQELTIAAESRHAGSAYSGYHNFIDTSFGSVKGRNGVLSRNWFCQYWVKLTDFDWGTGLYPSQLGQLLSNVKFFRLWNPGSTQECFLTQFYWGLNEGAYSHPYIPGENPTSQSWFNLKKSQFSDDNWHCLQFEWSDSSVEGAADATFKCWFDGALKCDRSGIIGRTNGGLKRPYHIGFYNAWNPIAGDSDTSPNNYYMTDVYSAPTLSRVELGNNAVYGSCTHREVQIPTAWSDSAITVTPYKGAFNVGDSVYLFVVNHAGTPSTGYGPIVLSAET